MHLIVNHDDSIFDLEHGNLFKMEEFSGDQMTKLVVVSSGGTRIYSWVGEDAERVYRYLWTSSVLVLDTP